MVYKGSDLTIIELLSALHAKVVDLSERKGAELGQELGPRLQQYVPLYKQRRFILIVAKICRSEVCIMHTCTRFHVDDLQYWCCRSDSTSKKWATYYNHSRDALIQPQL